MKRLNLDYRSSSTRTGLVLLVLAVLFSVYFSYAYIRLNTEKSQWEAKWSALEREQKTGKRNTKSADLLQTTAQLKNAKDLFQRLTLPWDELFKAIEFSNYEKIALLDIQPDTQKRIVLITGEAKHFSDILEYVKRLSRESPLTGVYLLNHQIQQQDPERPIKFTVSAYWLDKK